MVQVVNSIQEMQSILREKRQDGVTVGFVPTMGALHEGHGSLVDASKQECDMTIVSIFVNLKQFAAGEDFDTYPRLPEKDVAFLDKRKVDYVFLPTDKEIYPEHFATTIKMAGPAIGLESEARPHFFHGVATIVTKLFMIIFPNIAYFGEKDYQQLCVIKRFTEDLSLPIIIKGVPTKREKDGLAMSSRNLYLSSDKRKVAVNLHKALDNAAQNIMAGIPTEKACLDAKTFLLKNGFQKVDYIEVRAKETLVKSPLGEEPRILGAATLDGTRLIDNIAVKRKPNA